MTTGPSGGSGTGPPKALSTFETAILAESIIFAVFAAAAIDPKLAWPSAMIALSVLGIYIFAHVARTRGQS